MFNLRPCIFILPLVFLLACHQQQQVVVPYKIPSELQDFESWKEARINGLTSPFGWLSVTGLIWLKEQEEELSVGTDRQYDVNIPFPASANFGMLKKKKDGWDFMPASNSKLRIDNKLLTDKIDLKDDMTSNPTIINYESTFWYLIKRGNNYGIRIKDTLNGPRFELKSIPTFEYNSKFVIEAEVVRASTQDSILITNVQGVTIPTKLMGWLKFDFEGQKQSIAFTDGGKDTWFAVYGDLTNSAETYGAGRFIYVDVPANSTNVQIDFNRSENPPCYFTAFATCPLPPRENILSARITAGERSTH